MHYYIVGDITPSRATVLRSCASEELAYGAMRALGMRRTDRMAISSTDALAVGERIHRTAVTEVYGWPAGRGRRAA